MVNLKDCYLQVNSNLGIVEKNGSVIGFTIKDDENKKIIYLNDSFLCLEELPREIENSDGIGFIGVIYLPFASSFVFCEVNVNIDLGQCCITKTCDCYDEKHFCFNNYVEPKRIGAYTYIINDSCDFPDGNELSNISLFNARTGRICSIGHDIKKIFDNSPLIVLNIRLVPMDNDIHRLEIDLGDRKTFRVWDTIYMGLKVINTNQGISYQVCNNFYNKNPKEDGYYLDSKLVSDAFLSKAAFLTKLSKSIFLKDLENEVKKFNSCYKRRMLI